MHTTAHIYKTKDERLLNVNASAKIDVIKMMELHGSGMKLKDIASVLRCSTAYVSKKVQQELVWNGHITDLPTDVVRELAKLARLAGKTPRKFARDILSREILRLAAIRE